MSNFEGSREGVVSAACMYFNPRGGMVDKVNNPTV